MRIISAVERIEFVNDRISYLILRGRWCEIVVNVHAPAEDKIDDLKDSIYEEHVFDIFHKYHMKMSGDFNARIGVENIFKPTVGNESLHEMGFLTGEW
jgi:hypothetical protein